MIIERKMAQDGWRWQVYESPVEFCCVELPRQGRWQAWLFGSYPPGLLVWLREQLGQGLDPAILIVNMWEQHHGHYAAVFLSNELDSLVVGVDPYAIAKLYVYSDKGHWLIGTRLAELLRFLTPIALHSDDHATAYFLLKGYTPARHTLYKEISKLPPAGILLVKEGEGTHNAYLDMPDTPTLDGNEYLRQVRYTWENTLSACAGAFGSHHVALSGGVDSTLLLASLLHVGVDRACLTAKTFQSIGRDGVVLNPYDVEFARRVASHYDVRHDLVSYDWSHLSVLDDFLDTVDDLGTEDAIGAPMFRSLGSRFYSNSTAFYAAQNADSVFSFASIGWPFLASNPPFVKGLGGWAGRVNLFGGLDRGGWEAMAAKPILAACLQRQYGVRLSSRTPLNRLSGMVFQTLKRPVDLREQGISYVADVSGLAEWFDDNYISGQGLLSAFEANPHGAFLWLFWQNYMQGTANRGTVWPLASRQMPVFLPFASLGILRPTFQLIPDHRFYWWGKYPVIWMARQCYDVPEYVVSRINPPKPFLDRLLLETFFANPAIHGFLAMFFPERAHERFSGILDEAFLDKLLFHLNEREFALTNPALILRMTWLLTLEHLAWR